MSRDVELGEPMTAAVTLPRWLVAVLGLLLLAGLVFGVQGFRSSAAPAQEPVISQRGVGTVVSPVANTVASSRAAPVEPAGAHTLSPLSAALGAYTAAVEAERAALRAGNTARAQELAATRVAPAHAALTRLMTTTSDGLRQNARVAEQLSLIVTVALIGVALLLLILLALRGMAQRARLDIRDALTGLLNRVGLARSYAALEPGQPLAVVMVDLNDLKSINDMAGHSAGDLLLQSVAQRLLSGLPPNALLARWGGDEFVAILPGGDRRGAEALLNGVLDELSSTQNRAVTFAFGVGEGRSGEPLDRPLAVADAAMYEYKERLRGTVVQGARHISVEEFVAHLATLTTKHDILTTALPTARALLGFDVLLYVEKQEQDYQVRALDSEEQLPSTALLNGQDAPFRDGVIAAAMTTGQTTWSNDCVTDPRALPALADASVKSCGASPVICRGAAQGAVVVGHLRTWRPITPQVRRVIESLALQLSDVHERQLMVGELRQALEGGQKALGIALELRDLETAGHTERVVSLASKLAVALGLSPEAQETLRQGAYLHDLGKLTVPDAVLLKPGRFTPEERAIMETHASRGHEIASQIAGLPRGTLDVIRSHHEKWDGSGYPDRLAGEAIPLLARIFAVCDVYDALTSARPYKQAWSHADAMAEIDAQSGLHFDPGVVQAFVTLAAGFWRPAPRAQSQLHLNP